MWLKLYVERSDQSLRLATECSARPTQVTPMTDRSRSSVWLPIRSTLLAISGLALCVTAAQADEPAKPAPKAKATSNVSMAAGDTVGSALYENHRRPAMAALAHISVSLENESQPQHPRTSTIEKLSLSSPASIGPSRP